MCYKILKDKVLTEYIVGYKLVAKNIKTNRYHSLITGQVYPKNKPVVAPEIIRPIGDVYTLYAVAQKFSKNSGYSEAIRNRTAVYLKAKEARTDFKNFSSFSSFKKGFAFVLVKAEISQNLAYGAYDDLKIAAGRKIKFMGELATVTPNPKHHRSWKEDQKEFKIKRGCGFGGRL